MESIKAGVLVIGGGLAGIMAALTASRAGVQVVLVTKSSSLGTSGNTSMAGGGFAASFGYENDDSPKKHCEDTIKSGAFMNNQEMVRVLAEKAPSILEFLAELGIPFIRDGNRFKQFFLPGHSRPRAVRLLGGGTRELMAVLGRELVRNGVKIQLRVFIKDLVQERGCIAGAVGFLKDSAVPVIFQAKAIVLATGGGGDIFPLTTNKRGTTADGLAMALRAGLSLKDLEFIQFTPTAMVFPPRLAGQSIGGILLGQPGARLLNNQGERFMVNYDPDRMEAATRDVVARAIYREILAGRGTNHGGVFLDVTGVPLEILESTTGNILRALQKQGIDLTSERIEIAPAVHFFMGGIEVDPSCCTGIKGLFAAGEVTAGVHGANRLSGNGLTEAVVFGAIAGTAAARYIQDAPDIAASKKIFTDYFETTFKTTNNGKRPNLPIQVIIKGLNQRLQQVALKALGLERKKSLLQEGVEEIDTLEKELTSILAGQIKFKHRCLRLYELENMILVIKAAITAALMRTESRGAHYRPDYPEQESGWLKNISVRLVNGELVTRLTPIDFPYVKPGCRLS
ncbi:FAD-dependent oxidoreductase [Desulfofundulus sp. TPOSR]|uniref:L-aspartate oxidase n=1 Tax=Desulfofundulus sp. TPOSR TaxID=2714340 RepID=UPI00140D2438|nr:FAD-dependent oxidoreductase [Desulfofundulus sp. TPOSR]NHM28748.1 FAD-dependent oxidoreductase [Desulfofundulus sp. TPOSR]